MHLTESLLLGLLVCALINAPMILRAKRLRRLAEAKLAIVKAVSRFEAKLLDGTIKNGDACHDVLFRGMANVQYREIYRVRWNPFRFPSEKEVKFHEMLHKELESQDEVASILGDFSQWYSRAYRTKKPFESILFACWVFWWVSSFRLAMFGVFGLLLSIVGIKNKLKSYRSVKRTLDEWLLTKTLSAA